LGRGGPALHRESPRRRWKPGFAGALAGNSPPNDKSSLLDVDRNLSTGLVLEQRVYAHSKRTARGLGHCRQQAERCHFTAESVWRFAILKYKSIGWIFLAFVAAVAAAVTVAAFVRATHEPDVPPTVLFVGDSYTAGTGEHDPAKGYPGRIASEAGWDLHVDAQGATGFISDGKKSFPDARRLIDRLADDKKNVPKVDILIVDAGRNDLEQPPDDIANALSEYLTQARKQWPEAKIVVVLPAYLTTEPIDVNYYRELLEGFRESVSAVGGTLIDPIAEGWYANIDPATMTIDDGVHPNSRGNALIANRMMTALRKSGVIPAA
jgi:lysophospholipase L1-like esterase